MKTEEPMDRIAFHVVIGFWRGIPVNARVHSTKELAVDSAISLIKSRKRVSELGEKKIREEITKANTFGCTHEQFVVHVIPCDCLE